MGKFDDLIPAAKSTAGKFDDLIPRPGATLAAGTADQKAGTVFTPSQIGAAAKRTFVPTKEQLPELIGATAAGIAGSAAGLPVLTAAGVTGTGAMIGEVGHQGWQAITGNNPPTTVSESLKRAGGAFARGAGSEMLGRGVQKLFSPFSGSVTPVIKTQIEAAKRAGVTPPLQSMTDSGLVQATERMAELGPFGGAITARNQNTVKQLEAFTEKIADGIGPDTPSKVVPELLNGKIEAYQQAFRKAKDAIYEPINQVLGDKPANAANTIAAIKSVLKSKAGGTEGESLLANWLERLEPNVDIRTKTKFGTKIIPTSVKKESFDPLLGKNTEWYVPGEEKVIDSVTTGGPLSTRSEGVPSMLIPKWEPPFNVLKAIRTEAGARGGHGDPGMTGIKSQLDSIYAAASKDMDESASKYGMKGALDQAEALYSTGIKKLQAASLKAARKTAESNPDALHKIFISKNNPTQIKFAREVLGDDGFNMVRKQWFDDLVANSKSIVEGDEVISPAKLANNIRKMGGSLPEISSDNPQLAQQLTDLSDVSKMLTRGSKITKGSQTGFIERLKIIHRMLATPLTTTEAGREFLTTGFPRLGTAAARTVQPATHWATQQAAE